MSRRSLKCTPVPNPVHDGLTNEDYTNLVPVGSFYWALRWKRGWEHRYLWIQMPYPPWLTGSIHTWRQLTVYEAGSKHIPKSPSWVWDGDISEPTLLESIRITHMGETIWSGRLTAGVLHWQITEG